MAEFTPFQKIPRLFRDMVVTEKIDGTNAAVVVTDISEPGVHKDFGIMVGPRLLVQAQSRKRFVTPGADNHGFAAWVWENAEALVAALGTGLHFGEWWGEGIGRKYGLDHKRFSLFNTHRWRAVDFAGFGLDNVAAVPVLDVHTFDTRVVGYELARLRQHGSFAAPGFMNPEGVVVYHTQGNVLFKATLEGDDRGKEWGA